MNICQWGCLALTCGTLAATAGFDARQDPFVIGFYGVDPVNEAHCALVREAGANYIHNYSIWRQSDPRTVLDVAQKHGLKVMYDLGAHARIAQKTDPEWRKNIAAGLTAVQDHPALGIWYIWDEPKSVHLPELRELNKLVKAASKIPTALVMNERADYWDTRGASDIWMLDNYPVRGEDFPAAPLGWHSRVMRNACAGYNYRGTPFMAVMQACDFSCFKSNIKDPARLAKLRFPNAAEMRFMIFSDLCYGVRGMWFFSLSHCHLERPAGREFFDAVLKPGIADLKAFLAVVPDVWDVTVRDSKKIDAPNKVSFAFFKRASGSYMILVNDTAEKRDLKINLNEFPAIPRQAKLMPWRFTRAPGVLENGILSVASAAPWEVSVWEVQP